MLKMMTLLAVVMLTEAAPIQEHEGRSLWWNSWRKCKRGRRIQADIDAPDSLHSSFHATVIGKEISPGDNTFTRAVDWTVYLTGAKLVSPTTHKVCDNLNWHIHTKPINPSESSPTGQCGPSVTSGHTDNGFACGGSSEWSKTTCTALTYAAPYTADRCKQCDGMNELCKGCEYGDLSGKLGKIQTDTIGTTQGFTKDLHIEPLSTYGTMSLVLHCCTEGSCAERIACGDIEYHD